MIFRSRAAFAAVAVGSFCASSVLASEGQLTIFANGEELATDGFTAPELTSDGWGLKFDHIYVTLSDITALQTDPPYDPESGEGPATRVAVEVEAGKPVTIDLTDADDEGRVKVGSATAPEGHYNAISWSVIPAPSGEWEGWSIIFIGTATKNSQDVPFVLRSSDSHLHTCGEFVGDERKGFVESGGGADLELTFHLDHVFGNADYDAEDPMNQQALGFDMFAEGGTQAIDLSGLHLGHVGEGHCAVEYR